MSTDARYDAIAGFYAESTGEDVDDPAGRALLNILGDVRGTRALDLACGHGRLSRELARRGASVTGIDISTGLLEKAQASEDEDPKGIVYRQADAASAPALRDDSFNVVTCNYGLSDIDDLAGVLHTVARVLRPAGIFAFSILHPCFPGWDDDAPSAWAPDGGYYREGWWLADNAGFRGEAGSNFRMLSTYFNALIAHGLGIERVAEPQPPEGWAERKPGAVPVPYALVVRCSRV